MATRSEENLRCSICHEIFKDPVLLTCGHSFCNACVQRWWTQRTKLECPLCKRTSLQRNPPLNLALRNLCEDLSRERAEIPSADSAALCRLHSPNKRLFCLDHQRPLCATCPQSEIHRNHSIRPISEAARDCKEVLRELLKPLQEKLEVLNDIKGNFDQTVKDIEVQAQDTERQIKDVFSTLRKFLKKEEQARIDAVKEEEKQKSQMIKSKSAAVSREISALSDTIRATEEVLRADDLSFLQRYETAADLAQHSVPDVPQPIPGALIDMTKHLNNLSVRILDRLKKKVTSTPYPQTSNPEPAIGSLVRRLPWLRARQHHAEGLSRISSLLQARNPELQGRTAGANPSGLTALAAERQQSLSLAFQLSNTTAERATESDRESILFGEYRLCSDSTQIN